MSVMDNSHVMGPGGLGTANDGTTNDDSRGRWWPQIMESMIVPRMMSVANDGRQRWVA